MEENSKKTRVREMFDSIAPRYDLLNHLLSFGVDRLWRRRMVGVVAAGTPAAILDVAAGTGDVAVALARRLPAARITGIDLSGEMLAVGRGKVARRGLCDRIELVQGDAEQLPFPDGTFDAVTIGFGIRNFGSIEAGLAEAFRVLRPGGRLCILEFSTPRGRCFGLLYRFRKISFFCTGKKSRTDYKKCSDKSRRTIRLIPIFPNRWTIFRIIYYFCD